MTPKFLKLPAVETVIRRSWTMNHWYTKRVVIKSFEVAIDPLSVRFMEGNEDFTRVYCDNHTFDVPKPMDEVRDAVTKAAAGMVEDDRRFVDDDGEEDFSIDPDIEAEQRGDLF